MSVQYDEVRRRGWGPGTTIINKMIAIRIIRAQPNEACYAVPLAAVQYGEWVAYPDDAPEIEFDPFLMDWRAPTEWEIEAMNRARLERQQP